jgi:hypothetical protein
MRMRLPPSLVVLFAIVRPAPAAPERTLTWSVTASLGTGWLDPGGTEAPNRPVIFLHELTL